MLSDYESILIDGNVLYEALLKSIDRSKWKESSQKSLNNILSIIFKNSDELKNRTYVSDREDTFVLHERGRLRYVDSFGVKDRTVRHALCDEIFAPKIRNRIIYDNGASVKGRGISHARRRFEAHLRKYYIRHQSNDGYILFSDFSKYYDNILHDIAKKQLLELVDYDDFISWLLDIIFTTFEVDCTGLSEDEYNELYYGVLDKLKYDEMRNNKNINDETLSKRTMPKSISIGDQLSQQIGIYYPHRIDNFIKIVKSQKYYGRYMDDWYIISESKEELKQLLKEITNVCKPLGLHINVRKTYITKLSSVYKYLQVKYSLTSSGKVIKRINPKRITAMRKHLKKLAVKVYNNDVDYGNVENMFRAWMGSFYKIMSKEQRLGLITLYEQLFNKTIIISNNKMIITEEEIR